MGSTGALHMKEGLGNYKSPAARGQISRHHVVSQFIGAEMIVKKYGFDRATLDAYALQSHQRAAAATEAGAFDDEIIAARDRNPRGPQDRTPSTKASASTRALESIGSVKLLQEGGTDHRGQRQPDLRRQLGGADRQRTGVEGTWPDADRAHPQSDRHRGRSRHHARRAAVRDRQARCKRAGMKIGDIDLFEVNEAFAPVPLAWLQHTAPIPTGSTSMAARSPRPPARRVGHQADGDTGSRAAAPRQANTGCRRCAKAVVMANVTIIERL